MERAIVVYRKGNVGSENCVRLWYAGFTDDFAANPSLMIRDVTTGPYAYSPVGSIASFLDGLRASGREVYVSERFIGRIPRDYYWNGQASSLLEYYFCGLAVGRGEWTSLATRLRAIRPAQRAAVFTASAKWHFRHPFSSGGQEQLRIIIP